MATLLCLHCGQDTQIEATKTTTMALCPTCEEEIAQWEVDLVDDEDGEAFCCEHEFIAEAPGRHPYCADCGKVF